MNKGVFLDRDGVLLKLVWRDKSREFGPPLCIDDISLKDNILKALSLLKGMNYLLFIVSNQPDAAKGNISSTELNHIIQEAESLLQVETFFSGTYYCLHHPDGIDPELGKKCECRKPSPYFIFQACISHIVDPVQSWMIGDRNTDIQCGKAAGNRTILINEPSSAAYQIGSNPDFRADNLMEAVDIILKN